MSRIAAWLRQTFRSWLSPPIASRVKSRTLPATTMTTTNSTTTTADVLPSEIPTDTDTVDLDSNLDSRASDSLPDKRVFVANMSRTVNYITLKMHMSQAGEVKKSFVYKYPNGLSTGKGHVEYFDWKSAQTALNQLTGTQMYRKPIELRKFSEEIDDEAQHIHIRPRSNYAATVIASNLKHSLTPRQFFHCFRFAGKVVYSEIRINSEGKSTGGGYVQYETTDQALKAVALFHGQILWGLPMVVRMDCRSPLQPDPFQLRMAYAMGVLNHTSGNLSQLTAYGSNDPISQHLRSVVSSFSTLGRRLTIRNLSSSTTRSDLCSLLSKAGNPLFVFLNGRENSAFVLYETCDEAHKAIELFNKSVFDGRRIELVDYVD